MGEDQKDLHTLMKANNVGGPSLVFRRYHAKGETFIRNNLEKPTQSLIGYDCNALYLYCLMQEMPTEHPIIRRKENDFQPEIKYIFGQKAREWLEWVQFTKKIQLQHQHNGKEHRVGKRNLPLDGWDPTTKTAYQFQVIIIWFYVFRDPTTKTINFKKIIIRF